ADVEVELAVVVEVTEGYDSRAGGGSAGDRRAGADTGPRAVGVRAGAEVDRDGAARRDDDVGPVRAVEVADGDGAHVVAQVPGTRGRPEVAVAVVDVGDRVGAGATDDDVRRAVTVEVTGGNSGDVVACGADDDGRDGVERVATAVVEEE